MKNTLFVLMLLGSLAYGQKTTPQPTNPPAAATRTPNTHEQSILEAGGLDERCQSGFNNHFNITDDSIGANTAEESASLSNASTCLGYITGWAQTLSGTLVMRNSRLWYIEVSNSMDPTKIADDLHKFLVANPSTGTTSSPLVLLKVAVDAGIATITEVELKSQPDQREESPATPSIL
jgi:hypothetical protein